MSTASTTAKIAVAAPMPMARVRMTEALKPGARRRERQECRRDERRPMEDSRMWSDNPEYETRHAQVSRRRSSRVTGPLRVWRVQRKSSNVALDEPGLPTRALARHNPRVYTYAVGRTR